MKYCPKCNTSVKAEQKFCTKCGANITIEEDKQRASSKKIDEVKKKEKPEESQRGDRQTFVQDARKDKSHKILYLSIVVIVLMLISAGGYYAFQENKKKNTLTDTDVKQFTDKYYHLYEIMDYDKLKDLYAAKVEWQYRVEGVVDKSEVINSLKIMRYNIQQIKFVRYPYEIRDTGDPSVKELILNDERFITRNDGSEARSGLARTQILISKANNIIFITSEKTLLSGKMTESSPAIAGDSNNATANPTTQTQGSSVADAVAQSSATDISKSHEPPKGKYPETSLRLLQSADLDNKSLYELKIMRNEIYARHGYIFNTDEMKKYFLSQPWYSPKHSDVSNSLSNIERDNINMIINYEKKSRK